MDSPLRQHDVRIRLATLLWGALVSVGAAAGHREAGMLGYVERVRLPDPGIVVEAKLDTGAKTSSLSAQIIKKFRRDGRRWVRFRLIDPDSGQSHIIVRERVRTVAIIQHDGERQIRPVVRMPLCIAGHRIETEVSLIDRSEFSYPLLLGRNTLAPIALVDPGTTHLSEPDCATVPDTGIEAR